MDKSNICFMAITELAKLIKQKQISPVEVTSVFLERIEKLDYKTNAFITIMADQAITDSKKAEQEIINGDYRGSLHGIPIGLKDLYYTQGVHNTGGSKIPNWVNFIPEEDSTVTKRLRQSGAIIIGKLNMHEFAAGGTNHNPNYGSSRNPWGLDHMTGGSSGGSGAAVAASLCTAAMGSDTGGSVRIPSALCGIVGLKPTYGRVSCYGVIPLSWSQDHPGPMTKNVLDSAVLMNSIAGYDPRDPFTSKEPVPDFTKALKKGISGTKIGIPSTYFFDGLDKEVKDSVGKAISVLTGLGAIIQEISLPHIEYSSYLKNHISMAEAANYHEQLLKVHADELTPNVRDRLELGLMLPANIYIKSQRVRSVVREDFVNTLKTVDALLTPTISITAPRIGQDTIEIEGKTQQLLEHLGRFTRPFNQTGLPACTVPCGFDSKGLPIGLQIVGKAFDESMVLRVAYSYEQATDWRNRRPNI